MFPRFERKLRSLAMKFLRLVVRNTLRNRRRTILTILSISMSLFLISTLRTLLAALESPPMTPDSAMRVVTRHQTSLANMMPISYRERIRQVPGVEKVIASQWFGGVYKDPANFFAQFAVDAESFFDVMTEAKTSPPEMQGFIRERTGALAGVNLAERYGWRIGDRVTLEGTIFPFNVETIITGLVTGGGTENVFYFHWDYFNELFNAPNLAGTFTIKARSADEIPAIVDTVDAMFSNSTAPTKTETEQAFVLGFMSMWGNVRTLVVSISTVVLFTIILVAANTMAMSIRERTGEIAILKTLGFSPGLIMGMMVAESAFISVAGGLLGSLGARYLFGSIDLVELTMGFLPVFNVSWDTILLATGISLVVAFASTALPAWNASRLAIADAVRRRGE
jgi:putative ABC transport system permease protein